MKIEIEITLENAALLFANNWGAKGGKSVAQIVQGLAEDGANEYRRNFPRAVEQAVTDFRSADCAHGDAARGVSPLDGAVRPAPLSTFTCQLSTAA